MADAYNWIISHPIEVLGIVGGLHAIAKVVVSLTPTDIDNKVLAALANVVKSIFQVIGLQPK